MGSQCTAILWQVKYGLCPPYAESRNAFFLILLMLSACGLHALLGMEG